MVYLACRSTLWTVPGLVAVVRKVGETGMFAVPAADGFSERTRRVRLSRGRYWVSVALVVAAVACVVPAAALRCSRRPR